jgi:transcriptional regulator with XRE-family HTH domain
VYVAEDALKSRRLSELREFLMSRRARVSPAEAGLPDGGARRRTPGLRREEVAVLAGVGASWYQWLEQGRDISVSPQVLDSVARVLRLSNAERRHLYVLAGLNPPAAEPAADHGCEGMRRLIDAWMPFPAHIMDRYYNCVMYNDAAGWVLGMRPENTQNCLVDFFTDPLYRARSQSWERNARTVVAQFRAMCADRPDDEGLQAVLAELTSVSPEFGALWARRDIQDAGVIRKELDHPLVGLLCVESTALKVPARPDLTIVLHTPLDEANTWRSWSGWPRRRGGAGRCTPWRGSAGTSSYALFMTDSSALDPEDRKIVTLARSARARNGVPEGAAVRDETGRTYVAGTVALESLKLSALQTAVAMAVASGAKSLEAAAVVTEAESASVEDRAAVRDLGGPETPVLVAGPDGVVHLTVTAG